MPTHEVLGRDFWLTGPTLQQKQSHKHCGLKLTNYLSWEMCNELDKRILLASSLLPRCVTPRVCKCRGGDLFSPIETSQVTILCRQSKTQSGFWKTRSPFCKSTQEVARRESQTGVVCDGERSRRLHRTQCQCNTTGSTSVFEDKQY